DVKGCFCDLSEAVQHRLLGRPVVETLYHHASAWRPNEPPLVALPETWASRVPLVPPTNTPSGDVFAASFPNPWGEDRRNRGPCPGTVAGVDRDAGRDLEQLRVAARCGEHVIDAGLEQEAERPGDLVVDATAER